MPDTLISVLIAAGPALLGAIVGGLSTYLATSKIEHERWQRHWEDELRREERRGIESLMEWLSAVRNATVKASELSKDFNLLGQDQDPTALLDDWPELFATLGTLDAYLSPRHLLPAGAFGSEKPVLEAVNNLRDLATEVDDRLHRLAGDLLSPRGAQEKAIAIQVRKDAGNLCRGIYEELGRLRQHADTLQALLVTDYRRLRSHS